MFLFLENGCTDAVDVFSCTLWPGVHAIAKTWVLISEEHTAMVQRSRWMPLASRAVEASLEVAERSSGKSAALNPEFLIKTGRCAFVAGWWPKCTPLRASRGASGARAFGVDSFIFNSHLVNLVKDRVLQVLSYHVNLWRPWTSEETLP